jgi:hypothetical protein
MHTKPLLMDFQAKATSKECISIDIDSDLDISEAKIKVLGSARNLLVSLTASHHIEVCLPTGEAMFVELVTPNGVCVKYVSGSGYDSYHSN